MKITIKLWVLDRENNDKISWSLLTLSGACQPTVYQVAIRVAIRVARFTLVLLTKLMKLIYHLKILKADDFSAWMAET